MGITEYLINSIQSSEVDEAWKEFISSKKEAIIYGAGRQARVVVDLCNMYHKKYRYLMTTYSRERWGLLPRDKELPLILVDEFPDELSKDNFDVIIAMNEQYNEEITAILHERKFKNIFAVKSWIESNEEIRENFYRSYFRYYGCRFHRDRNGEQYLEYSSKYGKLKMYFPDDPVFKSNTLGELGNIVLPSIFDDENQSCLGPYEYGSHIRINKDDIVFDLGANVGLFSCVAATKGARVYAFEPAGIPVMPYLKKNANLYENITVIEKAVGNINGKSLFYYNNETDKDYDMCQSSIHRELRPDYATTEVDMIRLDDFVKDNGIKRVDFIKSHIEYAENLMLEGAKEILRTFAPKLSFYSQKALGNERYKDIEKIILEANAMYKIWYDKRRIYACVEDKQRIL